jgi:hypothetical protein
MSGLKSMNLSNTLLVTRASFNDLIDHKGQND